MSYYIIIMSMVNMVSHAKNEVPTIATMDAPSINTDTEIATSVIEHVNNAPHPGICV